MWCLGYKARVVSTTATKRKKEEELCDTKLISPNGMLKWYASRVCCVSSQKDQEKLTQVKVSINMLTLKIEELF